jgi:ATP-binding cassette subfamily F protein 3
MQAGMKSYGHKQLFDGAQFAINENEHVGVIGPNGAGKTTLFRILTGHEMLDSGTLVKSTNLKLGYLAQHDTWNLNDTVEAYLEANSPTPIWELKQMGRDLWISDDLYGRSIGSLSGGYRMRVKLLWLLGEKPNLMLLDEPTNYLDLETTLVLERFLQDYRGSFLLISHDREFLRRTTDHILEVEQGDITKFNGNIDDYFEQKEMLREQLAARAMSIQQKRDEVMKFVERFGAKASKARQAQSRLKSLSRLETIEVKALPVTAAIKIPNPEKKGKLVVNLEDVDAGYGDKVILRNVNIRINQGDHLAVVGLNGAGKSTLLKTIAGRLEPVKGKLEWGIEISVGYYAQHVSENLVPSSTVIEQMTAKAHPSVTRQEGLNMAGSLLFSGDDVHKKISMLSGGEKARVALGQILLQKCTCLVLDEPTNHLDFQTVEALTQALMAYQGAVIVVSHDRSFVRRIGVNILEIDQGRARQYLGTYDEYVWSLQKGVLSEQSHAEENPPRKNPTPKSEAKVAQPKHKSRDERKKLEKELRRCERTIDQLDETMGDLQRELRKLNDLIAKGQGNLTSLISDLGGVQSQMEQAETAWIEASELREKLQADLAGISD